MKQHVQHPADFACSSPVLPFPQRRSFLVCVAGGAVAMLSSYGRASGIPALCAVLDNTSASKQRFNDIILKAEREQWAALPIGERVCRIALEFVGTPYRAGTLESRAGEAETCKVDLTGLDCVTLFETSLCIARLLAKQQRSSAVKLPALADVLAELTFTRYRGGVLTDYTSRLHYTSEWFSDNERKGVVENITRTQRAVFGSKPLTTQVNFMSSHSHLYPALKKAPALVSAIRAIERSINAQERWFVPLDALARTEEYMHSGDIVGIVTSKQGLDYSHTGLVYRDDSGMPRFLHASQRQKRVVLDSELSKAVAASPSALGVTIVRPREVV